MLISTMTSEEIQDEIYKDYSRLTNSSTLSRLAIDYTLIRKKNRIHPKETYPIYFKIKTKSKNNWLIQYKKDEDSNKFISEENCSTILLTSYQSGIGIRVFLATPSGILKVYNGHFFNRYQERMNLPNMPAIELVKTFFKDNLDSLQRFYKRNDENRYLFTDIFTDGIGMGHIEIVKPNVIWFINNTFLPNSMLSEKQWEGKDHLSYLIAKNLIEAVDPQNIDSKLWSMGHAIGLLKDGKVNVDIGQIISSFDSKYNVSSWGDIIHLS